MKHVGAAGHTIERPQDLVHHPFLVLLAAWRRSDEYPAVGSLRESLGLNERLCQTLAFGLSECEGQERTRPGSPAPPSCDVPGRRLGAEP
eukprot:3938720-Rhodomonas_salina.1